MATAKKPTAVKAKVAPAAPKPAKTAKSAAAVKPEVKKVETVDAPKPSVKKVEPVEAAIKVQQDAVATVAEASAEVVEQAVAASQEQVAAAIKAGDDALKGYEEIIEFSKSNIDAFVKSNEIASAGWQEINSTLYNMAQANIEESIEIAQKFMTCGSVVEIFEMQQELARVKYEKSVAETRKLSELSLKVAEKAAEPISERVNVAIDTFSKPIAA